MPAFSAYGKMFENAARKDVQGNVDKLRSRAKALQRKEAGAGLRERELDPAKTEAPDSAARALFWINKIVSQIAMSFEFLLDRPNASLTRCATDAYVKTCGPYNKMIHRNIAKVMLKIIPDRESFVQMYGAEDMAELAPTLRAWIKASKSSRRAVDEFFRRNPDLGAAAAADVAATRRHRRGPATKPDVRLAPSTRHRAIALTMRGTRSHPAKLTTTE